ncbi:MAG: hypothetical protein KH359_11715 [Clostridiales bacterium]|nr:hypothetical protein [Proteus hauseri]MBS6521271.1 hypothetical protein [Clostridiales bacterium]
MKKNIKRLIALTLVVLMGVLTVDTGGMTANASKERTEISENEIIKQSAKGEEVLDLEGKVEGEVTEDTNEEEKLEGESIQNQDTEDANQEEKLENKSVQNQDTEDGDVEVGEEDERLETSIERKETLDSESNSGEEVQEDPVNYEEEESATVQTDVRVINGEIFDMRNAFQSSGTLMNQNMTNKRPIVASDAGSYFQFYKDRLRLGQQDVGYKRQTIMLTSKYDLDFNAKFEIEGSIAMGIGPDGVAFAFHTDKDFKSVNTSGSLGVYYDQRADSAKDPAGGLKNAFIFEIDSFYNAGGLFGDQKQERHIEALETDGNGSYWNRLEYWRAPDALFTKYNGNSSSTVGTKFKITWQPVEQTMKIEFPEIGLSGFKNISSSVLRKFKLHDSKVYFSVSASLAMGDAYSHPIDINISKIKYTDLEPVISTKVYNENGTKEITEAIPGETITVEHKFKNGNLNYKSSIDNKDVNFEALYVRNTKNSSITNLEVKNIKKWTHSIEGNPDTQSAFDKNNPLKVNFPSNNREYIVRYQVKLPETLDHKDNYGIKHELTFRYLYGQVGMTQKYLTGELPILIRPNISSKRPNAANDTVDEYEVYKINVANNVNEIDKATVMSQLWEQLYVQPAGFDEEKLTMNQDTNRVKIEVIYYLNGQLIDYNNIPAKIPKGSSLSMRIKGTDKGNTNLVCYYNRTIVFADYMSRNNQYVLYANNLPEMKETKLNTLTVDKFKNLVKTESKAIGLKRNDDGTINTATITVAQNGHTANGKMDLDAKDQPHEQEISITESPDTKVKPTLKVTSNTIGVDNGVNNPDGDTAYVIIPKNITLVDKKGSQDISGSAKVFMADYETNKKFDVYVPKSIQITNKDNKKTININTSGGTEESQERKIGTLNSAQKELTFNLSGNRDKTAQSGEVWNGKITFRIEAYR